MKKRRLSLSFSMLLLMLSLLAGCEKNVSSQNLTSVRLNEVAHSIFYAPLYVAIEEGYFEEEGIDLQLITGFGADKTMTSLLSGDADIGFMGPETTLYTHDANSEDPVINFAQLTQRAGNFIVARQEEPDFTLQKLKGKYVLGGREGGMPEMVFEYILKKNGIDPQSDLTIDQSIDFGSTAAAFSGGKGDYTVEFEPSATALEAMDCGYTVVASLGIESGFVPYTCFSANTSYVNKNKDAIQNFTDALQKGMNYVNSHTPEEIAKTIKPQFKETKLEAITTIVARYQEQATWKEDLVFEEESFDLLQNILEDAGQLSEKVPYEQIVNTDFAKQAKAN